MKKGFTMAEILITLGIIGVVAALTIPTLINKYRAVEMKTRFDKAYSTISQAFELMKIDNGGYIDGSSYSAGKFAPVFQQYFRIVKAHTGSAIYDADLPTYKNFAGNANFYKNMLDDGTLRLADGTIIYIENPDANGIQYRVFIFVDINGIKQPNTAGKDLFGFQITNDSRLIPLGAKNNLFEYDEYVNQKENDFNNDDNLCNETSRSKFNGIYCTYKALNDKDYFKKIFSK